MAKLQKNNEKSSWWVIVMKVIAYAIGLILAGYGTTACVTSLSQLVGII